MALSDRWEEQAANWIAWARTPNHDSYWRYHRDQFFALLPEPGMLTVDVGCGEGRLPRDLKKRGHRVIGVDASPTLIAAARDADPEGDYRCANAAALPLADGCCDLATAFMSLQDVDDLPEAVSEISRILIGGGVACIAIVHPLNSAGRFADRSAASPFVITGAYLADFEYSDAIERDGRRMTFHSRHRTIETYSRAIEHAGLVIDAVREPSVPDDAVVVQPRARWQRVPLFLHLRVRKRKQAFRQKQN